MALRIPGIIVRVVNDTGVIVPSAFERYPVYIGEGDPYRLITNEKKTRGTGDTDTLSTPTSAVSIVSVGDLPGKASYTATTDYTLSGNDIDWSGAASEPIAGDSYYVTYTDSRPATAYEPILYLDENLVYADHGNRVRTDSTINDVSEAAHLGFTNGANGVIVLQLDLRSAVDPLSPTVGELETAFTVAITKLEEITDYKLFLVPMSSGTLSTTTAANLLFNHAVIASEPENKQERSVIAAQPKSTGYQTIATYAQSYAHERMIVPAVKNTTVTVVGHPDSTYDTRFYNAALAGKLCSVGIGREISDEIISGLTFENNYTPTELEYLVRRGVSPAKIKGEVVRNVLAITSNTTSALTESLGVQDISDYVKKFLREGLWAIYRNAPITDTLIGRVTFSTTKILRNLQSDNIINNSRNVSVNQDEVEPRQLNVSAQVQPAFGTQYMDVTFTFVISFS
jgi:hypothetical protein